MKFNPTPKVDCRYGAPMGRHSFQPTSLSGKCHLVHIRLDAGGYDKGGAYWGIGDPLWYVEDADGNYLYTRGASRAAVKADLEHLRWFR